MTGTYNGEIHVGLITPHVCIADLNHDGIVGAADLGILLGSWGSPGCGGASPCPSDLNGDGNVNSADLGILLGAYGDCPLISPCSGEDEEENSEGGGSEMQEDPQFAEFVEWAMNATLEELLEWLQSQQQ